MMYSEFIEGTGCRENDHNYKVFKDLEIMYMNSDLSKQEIYEYGKKLVDNTVVETQLVKDLKAELQTTKNRINEVREEIKDLEERYANEIDDEWKDNWKKARRRMKNILDDLKNRKREIEWILNS